MAENKTYNDSPTFIPARLESSVHGLNPVADAKDIYDINHNKWQKDINDEVEAIPTEIERIDGELEDRYTKEETYSKTEVDTKESGLQGQINTIKGGSTKSIATIDNEINGNDGIDERLSTVEELAQISIDGGTIGIATASDFDDPTPEQEAKVTTVGAILGVTDDTPTTGSNNLVKSGGVIDFIAPYIDKVTISLSTQYTTTKYAFIEDNVYKIKNNTSGSIVAVTRTSPDSGNVDRIEIDADSEETFTASENAAYLYVYRNNAGTIDIYSMSTGENLLNETVNLLNDTRNKIFTDTFTSANIDSKLTTGIYKNPDTGTLLLVRHGEGSVCYQAKLEMDNDGAFYFQTRTRNQYGNWEQWSNSIYTNTSEVVQIVCRNAEPNLITQPVKVDDTHYVIYIDFSSLTFFVTSMLNLRVNYMDGFSDDKLRVSIDIDTDSGGSGAKLFKLLLDKSVKSGGSVVGGIVVVNAATAYDPNRYALIMCGRLQTIGGKLSEYKFSVPIAVDGITENEKTDQLYDNIYGESDDIKEMQYTNNDMIWTWWDYPQAIVGTRNNGHLFFGYTDAAGHVGVCEYDPERDTYTKCNLRKHNYVDDHNSGTVIEDENGKLVFLSDGLHGTSNNIHWRKTKKIENPDTFERDRFLSIGGQCVYTQVHKVGDRWYVFTRKDATSWVYISTTDFEIWTSPKTVVTSDVQWYCLFKPVTDESSILRIAMYSNPTAGDSSIRLAYIDLSDDKIYDGDGTTVLGTAGTGVDKNNVSVLIAAVSPKKIRLQDLAVTAMDDIVISYYDMEGYADSAQYKVYRNGTIIDTVVSDKPIGFSYHGGQIFIGDNKDKLVVSRYDIDTDYDIIETYEYSNGNYVFVKEYHRTRVYWTEGKNIREGRPRTDTSGKYIITHIGYLWFNSDDPHHPNYTEFMTSANVYKIEE